MFNNFKHSIRNVWRNKVRAAVILSIIGIAAALVLTMTTIDASVQNQVKALESSVGTGIDIRPAGSFGGLGSGNMLAESLLEPVKEISHVDGVETSFTTMLSSLGQFSPSVPSGKGGPDGAREGGPGGPRGLMVTGVNAGEDLQLFGGGKAKIQTGRNFVAEDAGKNVAIVGEALAEANEWTVGDEISLEDSVFEIVGIVSSDTRFGDMSFFLPLQTAQAFSGQEGSVSQARVLVDELANVDAVVAELRELLGDQADVVAEKDSLTAPIDRMLGTIETITHTGVWLALGTAGIVILATMIITVKERNREIGILKAIGASRSDIAQLFTFEALVLVVCGLIIGVAFFAVSNQFLVSRFLDMSVLATQQVGKVGGPGGAGPVDQGGGRLGRMFGPAGVNFLLGEMTISLEWKPLLVSLTGLIFASLLGSLIPAVYAARLKPTEVLRNE